ncbi:MAG: hypothetical protein E6J66_06485 [Deltaproteobacteria bacterium]|nr:MAG: hypothetical protein E6J66_06485 [Deltaproteobacteria bacterium]
MAHESLERQAIRRNKDLQATCAAIVRRLGIVAVFGGMLFGKVGLDPAVAVIKRHDERGRLVSRVWKRWTLLGAAGMVAAAIARWAEKCAGPDVDPHTRRLSFAADILFGIASLTGALNVVCGVLLTRTARGDGVPLETGLRPGSAVNRRQSYLHRTILAGGWTQLAALTGVLALEAAVRQDNYR